MSPELSQTDVCVTLARIEEQLDAQNALMSERLGGINARLDVLTASSARQGERIGRLEAAEEHRRGQLKILGGILTIACGAVSVVMHWLFKLLEGGH